MQTPRHTCVKLEIPNIPDSIFVKGTWFDSHFNLAITDGLNAWVCHASEEEVNERAAQWDQPVKEYVELAERYLAFQQRGSVYGFTDTGQGQRRLSWTFEKEGTKLEWRWRCQPSPDSKKTTSGILDFLMDANIKLSDEVVRQTQLFEKAKLEDEKCLSQSERFSNEKMEFESAIYAKFHGVLNSKKRKLRELRDQLSKKETSGKGKQDEEESTDKTESFDDENDNTNTEDESLTDVAASSNSTPASRRGGQKRMTRK